MARYRRACRDPLFVGESNPYSFHPADALSPFPENAAGDRLRKYLGLTLGEYHTRIRRVNLFFMPGKWSIKAAREAARAIHYDYISDGDVIFMLGSRVAAAFGMSHLRLWEERTVLNLYGGKVTYVRVPHPSGRCREWNDRMSKERMRRLSEKYVRRAA